VSSSPTGTVLAPLYGLPQTVIFSTHHTFMQLLCHPQVPGAVSKRTVAARRLLGLVVGGLLAFMGAGAPAQVPAGGEKLWTEVGQWVQQTQQLTPNQFTFAPMDGRVQLQTCDRALVMDSPFASRETVRVRCLGNPAWQLYMRVVLKPGVAPGLPLASSSPTAASSAPSSGTGAKAGAAASSGPRKVVVASQLLRAGSLVLAEMVQEVEFAGQAVDPQAVSSIKDVENGEMVRDIPAGVPLRSHDVRRAVLVKQGQAVMLTVTQGGGFSITARVEALQDGRIGEQVRLKNPDSGRILSGVVTGPNTARGL
jgi:flagellar basal body P-ring formation protein FlgA